MDPRIDSKFLTQKKKHCNGDASNEVTVTAQIILFLKLKIEFKMNNLFWRTTQNKRADVAYSAYLFEAAETRNLSKSTFLDQNSKKSTAFTEKSRTH